MNRLFFNFPCLVLLVLAAGLHVGCRKSTPSEQVLGNSTARLRIVSLSPAISRTLKDFGLESHLVGRTAWCESVDPSIPVVGDLYNLDYENLIKLDPTHVLVQPPSAGIDRTLLELAEQYGWRIGQWKLDSLDQIEHMVLDLPGILYHDDKPGLAEATAHAARLVNSFASIMSPGGKTIFTGRTLLVTDVDPVLTFGRGSFLYEILLAQGGHSATDEEGYPTYSLEDVLKLDPEAIVLVKPNVDPDADPMEYLGALADTSIRAIVNGRVAVLSHPDAVLPSTGLIEVAKELRAVLISFAASDS